MTDLLIAAGIALLAYFAHCFWFPWKPCPSCKGNPRNFSQKGNAYSIACFRCGSDGRLRRIGSRIIRAGRGKL